MQAMLTGPTLRGLFLSCTVKGRLQLVDEAFDTALACMDPIADLSLIKLLIATLKEKPYAAVTFFNVIKGHYQ